MEENLNNAVHLNHLVVALHSCSDGWRDIIQGIEAGRGHCGDARGAGNGRRDGIHYGGLKVGNWGG